MQITETQAVHVRVPLETPYVISRGQMDAFDSVIVRLATEDGDVGYGESVPLSVVGDPVVLAQLINGPIADILRGADPFDVERLVARAAEVVGPHIDALGGVDLALWDLMGKYLREPVYRLLGGVCQELIQVDFTVGAQAPDRMAEVAQAMTREGFRGVVVKLTAKSVPEDVARVRAVRRALPESCTVRVDCNGGYTRDDAVTFLKAIRELEVEFVEQPVAGDDLEGMRRCREVGIAISADESLNTPGDALALVRGQACDVLNIKVPKVGGLLLAKRIAAIGAAAGLPVVVGGRTTLELARYASRHFAASTMPAVGRAHEGPGPASQALTDDIVTTRTTRAMVKETQGHVRIDRGAGLGADVVWAQVQRYA
ncbi:MAG TPA: mandelate racemase/muconate lactonizing enzyme family protein, partial [bacterium]|nr:mandelate racemase/muconate lactonizing enzyme family protein [bacterium]